MSRVFNIGFVIGGIIGTVMVVNGLCAPDWSRFLFIFVGLLIWCSLTYVVYRQPK